MEDNLRIAYKCGRQDACNDILTYYLSYYDEAKQMENGKEPWSYWRSIIDRIEHIKNKEDNEL